MKRLHTMLIVLLVLDVAGLGGLWWSFNFLHDKKIEEGSLRQQYADEEQKGKTLTTLSRTLETTQKDHAELSRFFYDQTDESQIKFLSTIEQLGTTTTGATVETKTLDLVTAGSPSFHGEFTLTGSWTQVFHVLRLIEEFPSRLTINRIDLKGEQAAWTGSVILDLTGLRSQ